MNFAVRTISEVSSPANTTASTDRMAPAHVTSPVQRGAPYPPELATMTRFTNPTKTAVSLVKAATGLLSVSLPVSGYVL